MADDEKTPEAPPDPPEEPTPEKDAEDEPEERKPQDKPSKENPSGDDDDPLRGPPEAKLSAAEQRRISEELRELRAAFIAEAGMRNVAYGPGDAFGGDNVEGDKHVHWSRDQQDPWRIGPIATERWRDIRARFAGTPAKESLVRLLDEEVVAVLQGPSGSGRTTTALAALAHRQHELGGIRAKKPPALLEKGKLRSGHGYLYDATGAAWAKRLTEADILGCRDVLVALGARLVILVGMDSDTTAVPGLVTEHRQPDPLDVLERQLSDRLPAGEYDIQAIVAQVPERPATPGDALRLAIALVRDLPTGQDVAEICNTMLGRPMRRQARDVLRQQADERDLGRRAFVIAGAVLDGLPTVQVCRAAYDLAKLLFKVEKQGKRARLGLLPFADMLDDWLGHAGEEQTYVVQEVDRTLSFRSGFAPAVLDAVWLDYVVAHKALLDWLSGLAEAGSPRARLKVAQAIARFATYDFEFIKEHCITRWSRSKSQALHMAAAWALEAIVAETPSRHAEVVRLAREWAREGGLRQRSTAVRLFGTLLGAEAADVAMRTLHTIAWHHPVFLNYAIRSTVVELFTGDSPEVVLKGLLGWTRAPSPNMRRLVTDCLTEIARLPYGRRPPLLTQYDQDPATVGDLWVRVLTSRTCDQGPWNALREWAKDEVDFTDLRTCLYAEPELRPRLRFYQLTPPAASKESTA
ncbi:hypothetical protein [Actinomadura sp. 6N118]|uniref:hypothetical protein n=1 Tax=Actinomadura sp. 6N118 TaxID=3375151 RepID=UPI0037AE2D15